jgi:hypothetical protein
MSRGPPKSIGPPRRSGEPEPKENDAIAERVKFSSSPPSQPPQDQDGDETFRRHARKLARHTAEAAVLFAWAHVAYVATARDKAEFLTRAGEDTARVLAAESVARDPTLAGEAIFREFCDCLRRALRRIGRRGDLG